MKKQIKSKLKNGNKKFDANTEIDNFFDKFGGILQTTLKGGLFKDVDINDIRKEFKK